jgi:hypothetical protein
MSFREFVSRVTFTILVAGTFVLLNVQQLSGQASRTGKGTKPLPRFEDYPVTEHWEGPASPVQLDSPKNGCFAQILERLREKDRTLRDTIVL